MVKYKRYCTTARQSLNVSGLYSTYISSSLSGIRSEAGIGGYGFPVLSWMRFSVCSKNVLPLCLFDETPRNPWTHDKSQPKLFSTFVIHVCIPRSIAINMRISRIIFTRIHNNIFNSSTDCEWQRDIRLFWFSNYCFVSKLLSTSRTTPPTQPMPTIDVLFIESINSMSMVPTIIMGVPHFIN